jgi:hypothetical protein
MKFQAWLWLALALGLGSCHEIWGKRVRGNGVIKTEERSVSSFKNVEVDGSMKVYVSQGETKPVRIEGDENLLSYVQLIQEDDKIIVKPREGYNLEPTGELKIFVTSPVYGSIEVSGATDIIGQTKIVNPELLELHASGAGDIKMELDAPKVTAEISGAGSIDLKGQTKDADLELTGAGHAHCYSLLSENTKVEISGAGSAEVYASEKLDATVSGAGSVSYMGNPSSVSQHVSGVGSVNKAN